MTATVIHLPESHDAKLHRLEKERRAAAIALVNAVEQGDWNVQHCRNVVETYDRFHEAFVGSPAVGAKPRGMPPHDGNRQQTLRPETARP